MSLRKDYEQFDVPTLKILLARAETERHRSVIADVLIDRGEHPILWTVVTRGWSWKTTGWEITRFRSVSPITGQEITRFQVWEKGTRLYDDAKDLATAKQIVQRVEDDRHAKTDYEPIIDYTQKHLYERPTMGSRSRACFACGEEEFAEIHHVVPEGWCQWDEEEHDYREGDPECRRCGAEAPEVDEED